MKNDFNLILAYCQQHGISLTAQQELVLKAIHTTETPLSSTDILQNLFKTNPRANRMTIHRACEYLAQVGLIHKIQINQTYTLCQHLSDHSCQLLICLNCGKQIEVHSHAICQALDKACLEYGFNLANPLEITGICAECRK